MGEVDELLVLGGADEIVARHAPIVAGDVSRAILCWNQDFSFTTTCDADQSTHHSLVQVDPPAKSTHRESTKAGAPRG